MQQCERAMFDLRRGVAIIIRDADGGADGDDNRLVVPVETGSPRSLATLQAEACEAPSLVLAPQRMRRLGAPEAGDCGRLTFAPGQPVNMERCRQIAYGPAPASELEGLARRAPGPPDCAAVGLLKRALLIPAALTAPIKAPAIRRLLDSRTALDVSVAEIDACVESSAGRLRRVSEADVPLEVAARTRFILFREPDGLREHIALLVGDPETWPDAVPVRLHSACLTGDLFGSLRCDCGEQLRNSVRTIDGAGGGVLLYLAQEGRGIGLANKLRAYNLQDAGMDTLEANCSLGFGADERHYDAAVAMLRHVGVERVSLLTNNPLKIGALEEGGITVADRQPLHGSLNPHNVRYLNTKAERSGHWLDELFARALPDE